MRSFSSFLKTSKRGTEENHDPPDHPGKDAVSAGDSSGQVQRRQSKRDFFRKLVSPNNSRSGSRASDRLDDPVKVCSRTLHICPRPSSLSVVNLRAC
jgi:hypothetical protein